jgi:hypothetical protein
MVCTCVDPRLVYRTDVVHARVRTHVSVLRELARSHVRACIHVQNTYMNICVNTGCAAYIHTYVYAYILTYVYTCIRMDVYTYVHTYTHVYIRTYTSKKLLQCMHARCTTCAIPTHNTHTHPHIHMHTLMSCIYQAHKSFTPPKTMAAGGHPSLVSFPATPSRPSLRAHHEPSLLAVKLYNRGA